MVMNIVNKIDEAILVDSKAICNFISNLSTNPDKRGLLSQAILANLRNLVEDVAKKIYFYGKDISPYYEKSIKSSIDYIKTKSEFRFIYEFHDLLQKSVSHYTPSENAAERLMLKYYEYLLRIKHFLQKTYKLDVLQNLSAFPLNTDMLLSEYYRKIVEKINNPTIGNRASKECYYVHRVKPFFVAECVYYEVTFSIARDGVSKFDRLIAFTECNVLPNYSVELSTHREFVEIFGKNVPIFIIDDWQVHIRACEIKNFSRIFGENIFIQNNYREYANIMKFLTSMRMPLSELVNLPDNMYSEMREQLSERIENVNFTRILDKCHKMVITERAGSNIISYLLYSMRNSVIKRQSADEPCEKLSNLYVGYGCIPFEKMPYCSSLIKHNPSVFALLRCVKAQSREHELFARYIRNNTEIHGEIFTPLKDISTFNNVQELIKEYNFHLYYKHASRKLKYFNKSVYLQEYVDDAVFIIKNLQKLSTSGLPNYTNYVDFQISQKSYIIDSDEKKAILREIFANSRVALIYGAAGTGKSTMMNYIAQLFSRQKKIFLASTHAAVENIRRKIYIQGSDFSTISKFLSEKNDNVVYDLLFVDECSTVSNADMHQILEKAKFRVLILVGDVSQIESIYFGNWFKFAQKFVPEAVFTLKNQYRTQDNNLLIFWQRLRNMDNSILEIMVKENYSVRLDKTIFDHTEEDEIILCLNYDGLYGINNINRFLQSSNPSDSIQWGINTYKIGDPILFNESERFAPLIHNNTKGIIRNIQLTSTEIWFTVELDFPINVIESSQSDFEIIGTSDRGNSIIKFFVDILSDIESDEYNGKAIMPFQISYAISIHKAQGLEYDSVKIVITDEVEEKITHDIFYTAVTRTKKNLKIYWSPETEKKILSRFVKKNLGKDLNFLRQLIGTSND